MNRMAAFGILAACILFGAFAQVLFKVGLTRIEGEINIFTPGGFIRMLLTPHILTGAVLYALSFFLWLLALSKFQLSFMYPMLSLAYIVTTLLAFVWLHEPVRLSRWIGVVLIIIGAILVGLNRDLWP
ncbi:EamA family transporter [Thermococcus sp. M36]|uniref:EamA family transporter n=1 Tax=Thermococcus sp. M36 TaxID=1638261 RepID=UPI00143A573B|nr:EamA family transporter [Thermococcus sp. M36]